MSGNGREAHPDIREWSGGHSGSQKVVGRPSRMSGSGREALPVVWEWSGEPHRWSGGLRRCPGGPPNVQGWSEGPAGCLGVVGKPFLMSGSG